MLKKCLIANRGEIAVRVIRACRELGIESVAVYSEADAGAQHALLADVAYPLGGVTPAESYLLHERLIQTALAAGCDCVHPGYGFLSESADFAQAVIDAGLTWVGPAPQSIRLMGVKTEARELMARAGVPLAPGFMSDDATDDEFTREGDRIGYPLIVKAAGGGGGKGIRVVHESSELLPAIQTARREAGKAFGDPRIFLERYIEHGRHIEVQVFGDTHGNVIHLYERECSAQRRHQKVIEESPSPLLTAEQREAIGQAAVSAARAVDYVNAGTVEFIASADGEFYFLEMNTRLQVEHPVTELVTGLDLVHLQFRVASGEALPLSQGEVHQRGHAIEVRIYAEDPANGFLPATGELVRFDVPRLPGIRLDSGVQAGDAVTIHYDPMLAKLIAHGNTRDMAITRLLQALRETVIFGVTTNVSFLSALLSEPAFMRGEVDTGYIDRHLTELQAQDPAPDVLALVALALSEGGAGVRSADDDPYNPWARADGWRIQQG